MASMTKATLMHLLLLGTVVAAHGKKVSCKNECPTPVWVEGIEVGVGLKAEIEIHGVVAIKVVDKLGVALYGSMTCPPDVSVLVLVYEEGCVKVKVAAVDFIAKLLQTLVGLVLGFVRCAL